MSESPATLHIIEQRVHISASPATVWSLWTEPSRMVEWWGTEAQLDPRPEGTFRVVMEPAGPVMSGAYVSLEPFTRLVFSFGWEANAPGEPLAPGSTMVEVTLTPAGGGTDLLLVHRQLPATHADAHAQGWALFVGQRLPAALG